ncbi:MAG: YgeY family selenium metabolism-linked hydrolase [bacterium]|jgi:putative selenium metabolism hydrolase
MRIDKEGLISLCRELIRRESLSGAEGGVAALLTEEMKAMGFDEVWTDSYGSVVGKVKGTGGGKSVLFDGHVDTVPVSNKEQWTRAPFGGEVADGRIYGRGASDMKGAVAAMVYALGTLAGTKSRPAGDVYFCGSVQEEIFEGVALGKVIDQVRPDCVVIGEASELNLKIGQRGRAEITVQAKGKTAHSANPKAGVNAVYEILPALQAVRAMELASHPVLGAAIIELTDIISSPYPGASVVPDLCQATFDRRLLVDETAESVLGAVRAALAARPDDGGRAVSAEIARATAKCYTGAVIEGLRWFPAWLLAPEHPLVQEALAALRSTGLDPAITTYSFCTNGSYSAGIAGIPTVGFGPSRENQAHVVDEYVEIEQVEKAAAGYLAIAERVARLPGGGGAE